VLATPGLLGILKACSTPVAPLQTIRTKSFSASFESHAPLHVDGASSKTATITETYRRDRPNLW
jgi:hypothetical protein